MRAYVERRDNYGRVCIEICGDVFVSDRWQLFADAEADVQEFKRHFDAEYVKRPVRAGVNHG